MGVSLPCKSRSPGILARDDPPRGTLWKERSRRGERAFVRIIAGQWKGRRIKTTAGEGYRPAMGRVREALFSMLAARGAVWEGMRVLDVFAGSGSLGWEALSRGARQACFLESDAGAVRLLHEQRALFGLNGQQARVLVGNALRVLAKPCTQPHDLVFFDPPYGRDLMLPALSLALARGWIAPQAFICAEVEASWSPLTTPPRECILETDRLYGQTRIIIWKPTFAKNGSPSTREPLTP